jgi:adenylate cyclase
MGGVAGNNEERWRSLLTGEAPFLIRGKHAFRHMPWRPRCKLCNAPFGGVGGAVLRHMGFAPWPKNPRFAGRAVRARDTRDRVG